MILYLFLITYILGYLYAKSIATFLYISVYVIKVHHKNVKSIFIFFCFMGSHSPPPFRDLSTPCYTPLTREAWKDTYPKKVDTKHIKQANGFNETR